MPQTVIAGEAEDGALGQSLRLVWRPVEFCPRGQNWSQPADFVVAADPRPVDCPPPLDHDAKFAAEKGLRLTIKVEVGPEGGLSKQRLEEIMSALRDLGLSDIEVK